MRILCLSLWLLGLLPAVAMAGGDWQDFTSAPGRFTIQAPGPPAVTVKTEQTPLGPVDRSNHLWKLPEATYAVVFSDLPPLTTALGPRPVFLQVTQGFKRQTGATVHDEADLRLQGHPAHGLEFVIPGRNGGPARAGRAQALLVDSRLYVLTATWNDPTLPQDRGQAFFSSFRLDP